MSTRPTTKLDRTDTMYQMEKINSEILQTHTVSWYFLRRPQKFEEIYLLILTLLLRPSRNIWTLTAKTKIKLRVLHYFSSFLKRWNTATKKPVDKSVFGSTLKHFSKPSIPLLWVQWGMASINWNLCLIQGLPLSCDYLIIFRFHHEKS